MQKIVKKQIGKNFHTFVVEGNNFHECLMEEKKLSFPDIYKCGLCDSDKLYLYAYITEEDKYEYAKIKCGSCKASLTFGQPKKSPDSYDLRRNEDGSFKWEEQTAEEKAEKVAPKVKEPENGDDSPF